MAGAQPSSTDDRVQGEERFWISYDEMVSTLKDKGKVVSVMKEEKSD